MRIRSIFSSRDFFVFNIALVSMMIGVIVTALVFSCTTVTNPSRTVSAQDRPALTLADIPGVTNSFREVAEYVIPSVVEIRLDSVGSSSRQIPDRSEGFHFGPGGEDSVPRGIPGIGSGVVVALVEDTHYLVTNNHVVAGADSITIVSYDRISYTGTLVNRDERRDLAVISFQTASDHRIPPAKLGDSDLLAVGDWVLAVGNPFGFASTITAGIVSAKGRPGPLDSISDFLQTDAAINQGNSGGPLVDLKGEVIGINTWITTTSGYNAGLGFAIPVNNIKKAITDIIATGSVENGWLGVEVEDISGFASEQMNSGSTTGAFITQVYRDSPAERADMRPGDIVVAIDGVAVQNYLQLVRKIGDTSPGFTVEMQLFRSGAMFTRQVEIDRRANDTTIQAAGKMVWPGLTLLPLTDDLRGVLAADKEIDGFVVHQLKSAAAPQAAGIRQGDIIVSINNRETKNLLDFYGIVNDTESREFLVKIFRMGELLDFTVQRSR